MFARESKTPRTPARYQAPRSEQSGLDRLSQFRVSSVKIRKLPSFSLLQPQLQGQWRTATMESAASQQLQYRRGISCPHPPPWPA